MPATVTALLYLVAAILFILALRGLSSPVTSRRGNLFGMAGMVIAFLATLAQTGMTGRGIILIVVAVVIGGSIGTFVARRIVMTALPQLVAAFHSLVGLAAVFVAASALNAPQAFGIGIPGAIHQQSLIEMSIGLAIGAVTFSGSLIAFGKLQGTLKGAPLIYTGQHQVNLGLAAVLLALIVAFIWTGGNQVLFWFIAVLAFALGFLLILPIGGADMPVVVSMLNSYSGWAACGIGFTIQNLALIITGALVGASGAILSYIMCKGMNRSIINVLLGGWGTDTSAAGGAAAAAGDRAVKAGAADDAAFIMKNARKVIVVPGYGMAVAQAQHALREMGDVLKKEGVEVEYAIHPVAGRMPGHMNVLLAEANVPYDEVFELEQINPEFATADVAYVIGANDVTNP
ncbi:MAG: NAD(P)(+) transhydrogenase (Re/Si-specific) subunit beta, partial [Acetobacteraceae bacterium]|nr:NAD(P)(+) transhydrogenase (Re/Si-specific) subunit beta [Acetobacteraceae bacterium]